MSSLKLNSVSKIYPSGTRAVSDVTMSIDDKEFVVIVGAEKSGKTSLIRMIADLEQPSSGTIEMDGKDITELSAKNRDIAVVFRGDTLYPSLTVYDNMAYGLKARHAPQTLIDQRVKTCANILGLTDNLYKKPKVLTSAEKQRVAIGRAMAREPNLYIFDEPLAGLDDKLRNEMLNLIINLQMRLSGSFIYATKSLSDALAIGTRIIVLREGMLQQADTPHNLYNYPANAYVAFYIGAPTCNLFFDAKIKTVSGKPVVETDAWQVPLSQKILDRFPNLKQYLDKDKKVILGVRPEDAEISKDGIVEAVMAKNDKVTGGVYCECMAKRTSVTVKYRDSEEDNVKIPFESTKVKIALDLDRIFLFDDQTRLTLLSRDEGYVETGKEDANFVPLPYDEEQRIIHNEKPKAPAKKPQTQTQTSSKKQGGKK